MAGIQVHDVWHVAFFLHALDTEVSLAMATRLKGRVSEVQLVVALQVHGTGPQRAILDAPQTHIVPAARDHPGTMVGERLSPQ